MDNHTRQKALYQLNRFINSQLSYAVGITSDDIAILYVIARYLDMPENKCLMSQARIARETRLSISQLKKRLSFLKQKNIINTYQSGRFCGYEFGEQLFKI